MKAEAERDVDEFIGENHIGFNGWGSNMKQQIMKRKSAAFFSLWIPDEPITSSCSNLNSNRGCTVHPPSPAAPDSIGNAVV